MLPERGCEPRANLAGSKGLLEVSEQALKPQPICVFGWLEGDTSPRRDVAGMVASPVPCPAEGGHGAKEKMSSRGRLERREEHRVVS